MDREELRLAVSRSFARTGRAPGLRELADQLACDESAIARGLEELAAARHVVLDEQDRIVMAHPFPAVPLGFSVMGAHPVVGRLCLGFLRARRRATYEAPDGPWRSQRIASTMRGDAPKLVWATPQPMKPSAP